MGVVNGKVDSPDDANRIDFLGGVSMDLLIESCNRGQVKCKSCTMQHMHGHAWCRLFLIVWYRIASRTFSPDSANYSYN